MVKNQRKTLIKKLIKKTEKIIRAALSLAVFLILIGSAFKVSALFGSFYVLISSYYIYSGELLKKPVLPFLIFAAGLITHFALSGLFLLLFKSTGILDVIIALALFLFIYSVGRKVKKGIF